MSLQISITYSVRSSIPQLFDIMPRLGQILYLSFLKQFNISVPIVILLFSLTLSHNAHASLKDLSFQFGYNYLNQSAFNKYRYVGDKWTTGYNTQINYCSKNKRKYFLSTSFNFIYSQYDSEEHWPDNYTVTGRQFQTYCFQGVVNINYKPDSIAWYIGVLYPFAIMQYDSYDLPNKNHSEKIKTESSRLNSDLNIKNVGINAGITKYIKQIWLLNVGVNINIKILNIWDIKGKTLDSGGGNKYDSFVGISGIRYGVYRAEDLNRKSCLDYSDISFNIVMSY